MLATQQIEQFRRDGYMTVGNAVTETELGDMRREVAAWVEESRRHQAPFGPAGQRSGRADRFGCFRARLGRTASQDAQR